MSVRVSTPSATRRDDEPVGHRSEDTRCTASVPSLASARLPAVLPVPRLHGPITDSPRIAARTTPRSPASTGAASPTTRSPRAPSTTSRRPRTGTARRCPRTTWCSTSSPSRGHDVAQVHPRLADQRAARRRGRLLSQPPAAALARPVARRRARLAARARRAASPTDATSAWCATSPTATGRSCSRCRATSARSTPRPRAGRRPSPTIATRSATRVEGRARRRARRRRLGGHQRLLVGAHDGHDAQAPDAVLHRGQRPRHLRDGRDADARRQHRDESRVVREPVHPRRRRHRSRTRRRALLAECVAHVRSGAGPALVRLTVPRLSSHSGPDNQKGYRTDAEIAADEARDPLPRLREVSRAGAALDGASGARSKPRWRATWRRALDAARARAPVPIRRGSREYRLRRRRRDGAREAFGGLSREERAALGGTRRRGGGRRPAALRRGGAPHAAARARR